MLSNLISNALKYSCDAVVVSACAQQSTVTVSVRDYGKGVPEDLLAKLTTPFFRVQGNRAKGLGLGLALSEHIIRSLGAEMTFCNIKPSHKSSDDEQDANGGFLAQVTLPLYEASAPS